MSQIAVPSLSRSDELIVNSVFDPENSPDTPTATIDSQLSADPKIHDPVLLKHLRDKELAAVSLVEQFSIKSTSRPSFSSQINNEPSEIVDDSGREKVYQNALNILSSLITDHPDYASAYNNRAQLRRWRYGDKLLSPSEHGQEIQEALDAAITDLDTSIQIASPTTGAAVSPNQAKLMSQAWTQRGAILWGLSKKTNAKKLLQKRDDIYLAEDGRSTRWDSWDSMRLEEEGSRSFFMAGMYGSEIGRTMAVKTNPYARLCAGIVKEAMRAEYGV